MNYTELYTSILNQLKDERNIFIKDVAKELHVNARYLYNITAGNKKVTEQMLRKLAHAYPEFLQTVADNLPSAESYEFLKKSLDLAEAELKALREENNKLEQELLKKNKGKQT